jgi:hypothetical protein
MLKCYQVDSLSRPLDMGKSLFSLKNLVLSTDWRADADVDLGVHNVSLQKSNQR